MSECPDCEESGFIWDGEGQSMRCPNWRHKTAAERMEEAMGPRKDPRQPIFRDHNCGGCNDGERPCREGNYNSCSWPRARND